MKDMNRKSWMKISNEDLCTKIITKYVSSDNKWPQSLKNKILKIAEYNLNAKKKKIATILTFVIKNWKLRKYIENIFWRNFRKVILTIVLQFLTCINALHMYVTSNDNSLQVIPYKWWKKKFCIIE